MVKLIGTIISILLVISSCTKQEFGHESKLVLNGILSDIRDPIINISHSLSSLDSTLIDDLFINDAIAKIVDISTSEEHVFLNIGNGNYTIKNFTWNLDHSYRVEVTHEFYDKTISEALVFPKKPTVYEVETIQIINEYDQEGFETFLKILNNVEYLFIDGLYIDSILHFNKYTSISINTDSFILTECDEAESSPSLSTECFKGDTINLIVGSLEELRSDYVIYVCSINSIYHEYNKALYQADIFDFLFYKPPPSMSNIKNGYGLIVMRSEVEVHIDL